MLFKQRVQNKHSAALATGLLISPGRDGLPLSVGPLACGNSWGSRGMHEGNAFAGVSSIRLADIVTVFLKRKFIWFPVARALHFHLCADIC